MSSIIASKGSLFTSDFLTDSIQDLTEWGQVTDRELEQLKSTITTTYAAFQIDQNRTEADTETELIWPVLEALGWTNYLTQQNLSPRGRVDVPDGLLFESEEAKAHATSFPEQWKRYQFGRVVIESKRWLRPLDRRSEYRGEETAPSSQMLRYLRRIDDVTEGKLRWGILTNGAKWRLYFSGARSVSEQFFELDLAAILNLPGHNDGMFALNDEDRDHWLRVFVLIFRRDAFVPIGVDPHSFHEKVLEVGKFYEERVSEDLSNKVFGEVFPDLIRAIINEAPEADLQEVREGALILLYRLLFILFAEDRDLLPVKDPRYDDYGLRDKVRLDVGARKDRNDVFSDTASRYWGAMSDLFRAIDQGDSSIGLPPYNGGLFDQDRTPILTNIRIPDSVMANVIDALSFELTDDGRKYINYRNLSVQQLGSIYERLLEYEVKIEDGLVNVRPNIFARKGSGSYYTPDDLVQLILTETLEPLVETRRTAFTSRIASLAESDRTNDRKISNLKRVDPATELLELKVCDPAMGSGHFLVSLVDYLADQVITAMAETELSVPEEWGDYISPLAERIESIRNTILENAEERNWTINEDQLDDRHIIRRMVLKRCIYGVDKNPMAVELAKVALWLHTFTVGAPLSFLDHHLRCGDSLFGSWVRSGLDKAEAYGSPLLLHKPMKSALLAATKMQLVEDLTDAEIAEAHRSADLFGQIKDEVAPLDALLSLIHALDWQNIKDKPSKDAVKVFFDGQFGDPLSIAMGRTEPDTRRENGKRFAEILVACRELIEEERFLNWQVTFPGIWTDWNAEKLNGGFDAVIGNPPWDRMKLQEVEWFAERRPEIAHAQRASDRKQMVKELEEAGDPLSDDYSKASERAVAGIRMARKSGDYPLLSGGDINLYSLFVERAMTVVKTNGLIGLITPIGIGADKTSARFFSTVSKAKRVKAFLAFENRRGWLFHDVHHEDQPTVLVLTGGSRTYENFKFAVKLTSIPEINSPQIMEISDEDCRRVNPNTGTIPIYRNSESAKILREIYDNHPILINNFSGQEEKVWPIKYMTMFHMTNDSGIFKTHKELLESEGAYPLGKQIFESASGKWLPLFEGKMVSIYNHRYAGVRANKKNISGQGIAVHTASDLLEDPNFVATPRYWVPESEIKIEHSYSLAFNDICNTNNSRSLICAFVPRTGYGNKLPILTPELELLSPCLSLLLANFCSIICDFLARQKIQSRNLNKYILEQIPVIRREQFEQIKFGSKTAAEVVRETVLELTYIAHDMAPFAKDMGYVDEAGEVKSPFIWDEERRLILRAKLDAIFFHLYGITDRDDIRYIYSTFPIIEREEKAKYDGVYRSCELCLAYMNALAAGNPDAEIRL